VPTGWDRSEPDGLAEPPDGAVPGAGLRVGARTRLTVPESPWSFGHGEHEGADDLFVSPVRQSTPPECEARRLPDFGCVTVAKWRGQM